MEDSTIKTEKLFVLGAPRSGTTFLSHLLRETRFGEPVESHFITKYDKKRAEYGDLSDFARFKALTEDILAERPVQQWALNVQPGELYEKTSPDYSYPVLIDALMVNRSERHGRNAWGDKTPHYLGDVDRLVRLFPDARFIHIVRDGRDVALSLLQKPWGPANIIQCAQYWTRLNRPSTVIDQLAERNQIFFLTYESLLEDPTGVIRRLYQFLGESLSDERLEALAGEAQNGSKYKWRQAMSVRQIRQFEALAGPTLERLGYDTVANNPSISTAEKLASNLHAFYARWRFLFKANVIDGIRIRFLGKQPFNE